MGIVDPVTMTLGIFHIGIHAHFHGGGADPGHFTLDDHQIVLVGAVEEGQIVHRGGGDIGHGVALCNDAGHLIDPLHQNTAEEPVGAVEVIGPYDVDRFHPGFVHGFRFNVHDIPLSVAVFFIIASGRVHYNCFLAESLFLNLPELTLPGGIGIVFLNHGLQGGFLMKKRIAYLLIVAMLLSLCGCSAGRETLEGIIGEINEEIKGAASGAEAAEETAAEYSGDFAAAMQAYDELSKEDKLRFYEEIADEQKALRAEKYAQLMSHMYGQWRMETDFRYEEGAYFAHSMTINEDMTYEYGNQTGTCYFDEERERLCFVNDEDGVIYFDFALIEEDGFPKLFYGYDLCYVREEDYREAFDKKYVTVWGFDDASEYFGQPVYVGTRAQDVGYGPNAKLGILDSLAYDNGLIFVSTAHEFEMELSWEDNQGRPLGQRIWNPFDCIEFVEGREISIDITKGAVLFVRAEYVEEIVITEDNIREVRLKNGMFFEDYNFGGWDEFPMENYDDFKY
jgi:hypothetical protein